MVSLFWFRLSEDERDRLKDATQDELKTAFLRWLHEVIRFESLLPDLERVCGQLDIPFKPDDVGRYKSESRINPAPASAYYDDESTASVRKLCAFEFEHFGYSLTP